MPLSRFAGLLLQGKELMACLWNKCLPREERAFSPSHPAKPLLLRPTVARRQWPPPVATATTPQSPRLAPWPQADENQDHLRLFVHPCRKRLLLGHPCLQHCLSIKHQVAERRQLQHRLLLLVVHQCSKRLLGCHARLQRRLSGEHQVTKRRHLQYHRVLLYNLVSHHHHARPMLRRML